MPEPLNPISCLIIDDESPARRVVAKYLQDVGGFNVLAECKNAFEAREAIELHNPDLIFLDINMPKLSGLQFLATMSHPPLAIITTAYREYALEGFELNVVDYLHKPFSLERFMKALEKVRERMSTPTSRPESRTDNDEYIFIKHEGEMLRLDLKHIQYIEAVGDYAQFVTRQNSYITHLSMKKATDLLGVRNFIRVHKSYIINPIHITTISGNTIFIHKKGIPLGATYRTHFLETVRSRMG